jgi:hypothetical protein
MPGDMCVKEVRADGEMLDCGTDCICSIAADCLPYHDDVNSF